MEAYVGIAQEYRKEGSKGRRAKNLVAAVSEGCRENVAKRGIFAVVCNLLVIVGKYNCSR